MAQPAQTWLPFQVAAHEIGGRLVASLDPVEASLDDFVRADVRGPYDATSQEIGPFATVWRFRGARGDGPPVVLVPPFSGYVAGVASPLIAALMCYRPVIVIEWHDARRVPEAAGRFGLEEQIEVVERTLLDAGPGAVVVGLSQSVVATLGGAALAAAAGAPAAVVALLAGPVDTRGGAHPPSLLLRWQPAALLEAQFTTAVPGRFPGAGRPVYPGVLQLLAYAYGCPPMYLEAHLGVVHELANGGPGVRTREHRDLHSLLDVPGELFLDTIVSAFHDHDLANGTLTCDGRRVDLAALGGVRLLTVEGTADDLVGPGQTHAAADLVPHAGVRRVTVEGARHHEMFTGARFFEAVEPHLGAMLDAA
ncbi:MAG: polyhydroxyalkanoate depolymerase [Pseudomonadota bacterium]